MEGYKVENWETIWETRLQSALREIPEESLDIS